MLKNRTTMFSSSLILAASFGQVACSSSSGSDDTHPVQLPERVFRPPAIYQVEDNDCQTKSDPVDLPKAIIPAWQNDQVNMVPVDLVATKTELSLRNGVIRDTVYGVEYERQCDDALGEKACLDQFGREKNYVPKEKTGWYLRVCSEAYGRKSIESVALAGARFLDVAHRKYVSMKAPTEAVPETLLLNVHPVFTDVYDNFFENGQRKIKKTFLVNNIGYYGRDRMIVIFPASQSSDLNDPGFFWESQFVFGHEYGHHIEMQRTGLLMSQLGIAWNPEMHAWEDREQKSLMGIGETEFTQILGSVSEGFADLLGFYTEGANGYSLIGLPKLGRDRDLRLATFADQTDKILTKERFDILIGKVSPSKEDLVFAGIHTGGAVLAHVANDIFQTASLAREGIEEGSAEDVNFRYRLALAWVDRVSSGLTLTKNSGADSQITQVSEAFAAVVGDAIKGAILRSTTSEVAIKREVCEAVQTALPVVDQPAFGLNGSCEIETEVVASE